MHGEPSCGVDEVVSLDALDDGAVIAIGQLAGDGLLEIETLAEDQ